MPNVNSNEYTNTPVQGGNCSYNSLANYNGNGGIQGLRPAVPPTNVIGKYIVPNYSAPGYNTLQHNSTYSCGGYFPISTAYGEGAADCSTEYSYKVCM